jgi:DNA-binding NarL/FixJ family response regulator
VMSKTILLADDSPLVGQTLYKFLATEGSCELCAQAADGDEAISLAKQYRPDLVILDLSMPKMNGLETARELKKIMPTVPIILFTLHASTVQESFVGDSCVDLVIPKGNFTALMDRVRTLLCAQTGEEDTQFSDPIH